MSLEPPRPPVAPRPDFFVDPEPDPHADKPIELHPILDSGRELAAVIAGGCLVTFWVLLVAETPRLLRQASSSDISPLMHGLASMVVLMAMALATVATVAGGLAIWLWARRSEPAV